MRHSLLPHPLLTLVLVGIWLLLNNTFAPGHVVLGLILGWAIPMFTVRFWPERVSINRPLLLLRFIAVVLWDIVVANLAVAWLIVGRPQSLRPAFLAVPLVLKSDLAIGLLANTICLTPGTVSAQLSEDRRFLLVHALDAADGDAVIAEIKRRYEQPLKEVFESC